MKDQTTRRSDAPSFAELFTPKLVTVLREGYGLPQLRADAIAGLTVAIVALPLSMAIAIASGATPAQGLYTAIVGGFLVSLLGGSRFQIGGPAGAFIVLVAATVAQHGMDGLILATFLSGLMLVAVGFLRLGTFIKFIPFPVTVGFTAGHRRHHLRQPDQGAVRPDAASRARRAAGEAPGALGSARHEPDAGRARRLALRRRDHPRPAALAAALAGHADRGRRWPRAATALLELPVADHRHALRRHPVDPAGAAPAGPVARQDQAVLPDAISFALLGAIESLLSAVVADGMTGRRHRSNCELVAQGVANIGSALFGGFCVTGTIARTATNVRAGRAWSGRRACCTRCSSCSSCSSRRRSPPTSRWRRWRACWPSWPGT